MLPKLSFHYIYDIPYLSRLLELYIAHLELLGCDHNLRGIAWNSGIPIHVLRALMDVYRFPPYAQFVTPEDYHIILDRLCQLHPTTTMLIEHSGEVVVRV